jgi:hypothetical protein
MTIVAMTLGVPEGITVSPREVTTDAAHSAGDGQTADVAVSLGLDSEVQD